MAAFAHEVRPQIAAETNEHREPGTSRHIRAPLHAAQHVQDDGVTEIVEHGHDPAGHPNLLLRELTIVSTKRKSQETAAMPDGHR
ncbi:hypothetical protein ACFWWB_28055 [Streptomyces sp. NPDC058690]|uniref:hypothetical protein n=1 Tax=Streptomyces sp. NPDC058690 TaxID=3346600 RepID=UPI00365DC231